MAVSRTVTFAQSPPKRPAEGDVINGSKTNATATVPPNFPAAEEFEQFARLLVSYGRMVPLLRLCIAGGTTPTIASFACVREDIVVSDLVVTRNAAGDVSVTWPSGTFPSPNSRPMACVNAVGAALIPAAVNITNGVRVVTRNTSGATTDADVTVEVF